MAYLIIILLGIIQGASEFLPISSSGHLVIFYNIFNITENVLLLSIILHLGTLLAILIIYRSDIIDLIKKPLNKTNISLLISTIITVAMVLFFKKFIISSFEGSNIIVFFLITATALLVAQFVGDKNNNNLQEVYIPPKTVRELNISYPQAMFIGFAQGLATIPGISRSGFTISMALIVGVNKNDAPTYSFLMSIPIIFASLFYEIMDISKIGAEFSFSGVQLVVGFIVAFVVGFFSLKVMIDFVKKQKLYIFSIYLALLSLFLTLNKYIFKLF